MIEKPSWWTYDWQEALLLFQEHSWFLSAGSSNHTHRIMPGDECQKVMWRAYSGRGSTLSAIILGEGCFQHWPPWQEWIWLGTSYLIGKPFAPKMNRCYERHQCMSCISKHFLINRIWNPLTLWWIWKQITSSKIGIIILQRYSPVVLTPDEIEDWTTHVDKYWKGQEEKQKTLHRWTGASCWFKGSLKYRKYPFYPEKFKDHSENEDSKLWPVRRQKKQFLVKHIYSAMHWKGNEVSFNQSVPQWTIPTPSILARMEGPLEQTSYTTSYIARKSRVTSWKCFEHRTTDAPYRMRLALLCFHSFKKGLLELL